MESKFGSLGTSLQVPMVQELVKEKLDTVPSRYVRPELEIELDLDHHHLTPSHLSSSPQIPLINMHNLFHSDSMDSELNKLHNACKEWGFFQLINHGVDLAVIEKMKSGIQGFFNLPIEEKTKFGPEAGDLQGYGQLFVVSEEQKLDWSDVFYFVTSPTSIRKPHLIPNLPPSFRDAIEAYASELEALGMKILHAITKALGMKPQEMEALFKGAMQSMRMNYYPPCPQPELVTGLYSHSDGSALTILLQLNEIEGLQINKDGNWIPVSPLPDAFIFNIGEVLEIVTNGAYCSIEHRATVNRERERMSVATFVHPKLDAEVGPAPSLINTETPAKFKRIGADDYLKGFLSKELKGKSYLDTLRI